MGVDCRITLPAAVRIRDVADVMGALAGFTLNKRYFGNEHEGWSVEHDAGNVKVESYGGIGLVACANIILTSSAGNRLIDGEKGHFVMYHFEGGRNGERLMLPPSTDFWIAIGRGLVDFFGGTIDYNDCDNTEVDYEQPARPDIRAEDGDEWHAFQTRKLEVKPLTKADLAAWRKAAAYQ